MRRGGCAAAGGDGIIGEMVEGVLAIEEFEVEGSCGLTVDGW